MNFLQGTNRKIVLFLFLLLILFGIVFITDYMIKQKTSQSILNQINNSNTISPAHTRTQENREKNPSYKKDTFIPTYSPEKGRGVDLGAPLVANSMKEIQKIYPFLPYEETVKTPLNQEVTVVIPDKISQTNQWTLLVTVYGLDYRLIKGDSDYVASKNSFTSAVSSVYKWIEEKGADPKKIMIVWGDKEFIQNKSQEWLE